MDITYKTPKTTTAPPSCFVANSRAQKREKTPDLAIDHLDRVSTARKTQNCASGGIQNALNLAISRKDNNSVERLLRKGANINKPDPSTGLYPVLVAAITGSSTQVFETVLRAKPDLDVTSPSSLKLTSVSHAAIRADVNGVKRLLEEGASLGAAPFWEHPPYTIVAGVEDWNVYAKESREILDLLENAAKHRNDYLPISEENSCDSTIAGQEEVEPT